jgi:predicted transposase YbfD/YdcC
MSTREDIKLISIFSRIEDPRIDRQRLHKLIDIIVIAICAVICGADTWVDIAEYGNKKKKFLARFLELPNGIPSHDTFGRVCSLLDGEAFQNCFFEWVKSVQEKTDGQVIAIDGKQLRRSHNRGHGKNALHLVSAWVKANHLVLGQVKVDGKSNEITAIPTLLDRIDVKGCIVTLDAMGCQKEIAKKIVEKRGDYVLAVKENQGKLYEDICFLFRFEDGQGYDDYQKTVNKAHGRVEIRECWTISDDDWLDYLKQRPDWSGLNTLIMVKAERRVGKEISKQTRFYISSSSRNAKELLDAIRDHWSIENGLHWVLDIAFREDESRVRIGHAAQNLATIRRLATTLLKKETSAKGGIKAKRLQAGWDDDYLLSILGF